MNGSMQMIRKTRPTPLRVKRISRHIVWNSQLFLCGFAGRPRNERHQVLLSHSCSIELQFKILPGITLKYLGVSMNYIEMFDMSILTLEPLNASKTKSIVSPITLIFLTNGNFLYWKIT